MAIWICIPVFNRVQFTVNCLKSICAQDYRDFHVVVCDHGSTDGTSLLIRSKFPDIIILNADSSLWWTGAINRCVEFVLNQADDSDFILTLNNDTELPVDYLVEMTAQASKYPHAVLTSVIHDIVSGNRVREGFRQSWWGAKDRSVRFSEHHVPGDDNAMEVDLVSGRGTLIPVQVFRQVGLYDEVHLPHYAADYDFGHKARRAGYPAYIFQSCKVFSYVDATGMTAVRDQFSFKKLVNFLSNIKSPANLRARWWYGWNNCPRYIFPFYIVIDLARVLVGYFRYFIRGQSVA
ncbi:glycosyltransferase family 2 protein [Methylomonas sp. UP202]|uniref:glycosyltransferase family 2 protein n=1 Tax=Methylomonas sp. UP202 TaxID=3040943 RepID=UPI00247AF150|nr:glycosyltransferase family 2 protein [Methylomonas sp. UP202]WGS86795.1 glycosyltransferase family 2 protein [Methylomonas sp. UP202]